MERLIDMKKKLRTIFAQSNLFQIVSCFFIFAILSNLIYIPCYFYIMNINRKNVIDHQQYQLENGMQTLNASMDAFFNITNTLSSDKDYRTPRYNRADFDDLTLDNLRKTVNAYLLPFDCITESGLIMGDTILFTKNRIYYELEPLSWRGFFSCSREDYLNEFSGAYCVLPSASFSTLDQVKEYEAITIGWRWHKKNNTYFFAHYSLDKFFSLFASSEVLDSCYLAVYHGDMLLAESGSALSDNYEMLTTTSSNQLGIYIVLQLSDSYIQQDLANMTKLIRIFISIVLIAALLWVLVFSFMMWQPYRSISQALYNTGHLQAEHTDKIFTDALVNDITKLGDQLSDYKQILETQKERSRIHIFEKALYRGLYGDDSREAFYNAFPDFPEKWQLVQIQYASDDETVTPDLIQSVLIQQLQLYWKNLFLLPQNQDTLLVLLPLIQEAADHEKLKNLCNLSRQQHHLSVSIIFSRIYEDPAFLADALQELEYEGFSVAPQSKTFSISMQQLQTIYSALQCGDVKTAVSALKNSTSKLLANDDEFTAKYSYRMLSYVLVRLKLENSNIINVPIPPYRHDDIHKLFEEELPQCFTLVAECLKQQQMEQTEKLDQDILDFIRDNLANQQLSVTLVAEQFHISAPTLQKRMNACCEMTFSAYVEAARMEKARQLLRDTNATVQEIAETVGYINSNSFYKAYKRCFGEPPLAYRNREGKG